MKVFHPQCLENRIVLLTGGCGDIGRVVVKSLIAHGAKVAVNDIHSEPPDTLPPRATYFQGDITKESDVVTLFSDIETQIGIPDVVCCHAGMVESFPIEDYPLDRFEALMDLNLKSAFLVSRQAARALKGRRTADNPGKIIFTSSWVQDVPWPEISAYNASKSGVKMLMKSVARELASQHITANSIAPGIVAVGLARRQWDADPAYRVRAQHAIPMGEMQKPESVADAFLFLCSDASNYMTGATLLIDGGCSLYPTD